MQDVANIYTYYWCHVQYTARALPFNAFHYLQHSYFKVVENVASCTMGIGGLAA